MAAAVYYIDDIHGLNTHTDCRIPGEGTFNTVDSTDAGGNVFYRFRIDRGRRLH